MDALIKAAVSSLTIVVVQGLIALTLVIHGVVAATFVVLYALGF